MTLEPYQLHPYSLEIYRMCANEIPTYVLGISYLHIRCISSEYRSSPYGNRVKVKVTGVKTSIIIHIPAM